ncbi:MAG: hypothetical protein Q9201_006029 [Fulgogasparrea decipioides]
MKTSQRGDELARSGFPVSIELLQRATITHASAIPGRTVWDLLLKQLWAVNSLDSLHTFFDNLPSLLEKPFGEGLVKTDELDPARPKRMLLSRNSPLGAFVRRSHLEFTRLQFHDGNSLWKELIIYRAPTLTFWKRRNPTASSQSFDANPQGVSNGIDGEIVEIIYGDISGDDPKYVNNSWDDLEKLYEHQVARMQRLGNRVPQELQRQLRTMAFFRGISPSVSYYVQFLDAWKAGDYPSSFDNLHRYFDYTMRSSDRALYQYALLNLAILQADFGCFSEAIIAMQETIATARENHDMPCLNYSLSWLYQFARTHPEEMTEIQKKGVLGSEKEALSFLKAKAKESNMWTLLSTTLLSEAKLALSDGDSVSQAFESIMKASHLNVTKSITEAHGSQMLMQSSIFDRLGTSTILARKGRYEEAISRMDEVDQESLRTLRYQQYWITNLGLLKLHRHLYRDELDAGEDVLAQLWAAPSGVPELQHNVSMAEIDLQIRRRDYSRALSLLEQLLTDLNKHEADIFQRLKAMILKARIYDKAEMPQKGFSVALRAASLAHKARLLPLLWEAVGAICRILVSVKEFDAAVRLIESVMPQALECEDCDLAAYLFSCLADGHMGSAGQAKEGSLQRKERLNKASEALDRAFEEYSRIEDIRGQCEMLAKKATTMHLNGDPVLANDYSAKYLAIKKAAREQT